MLVASSGLYFHMFLSIDDLKVCKKLFQRQKIYFNQQTACGAPVRWSKYTTDYYGRRMINTML